MEINFFPRAPLGSRKTKLFPPNKIFQTFNMKYTFWKQDWGKVVIQESNESKAYCIVKPTV